MDSLIRMNRYIDSRVDDGLYFYGLSLSELEALYSLLEVDRAEALLLAFKFGRAKGIQFSRKNKKKGRFY